MQGRTISLLARVGLFVCVAAFLIGALPVSTVSAAGGEFVVNSALDDGTGACTDAKCTLRDAITTATSGDLVKFAGDYAIKLASPLTIDKSLTINGAGHVISVSGDNLNRVFDVSGAAVDVAISNLAIINGFVVGDGAGILVSDVDAKVTLTNVTMTGGWALNGGAIANAGMVSLINTTIAENKASSGGGIYTTGSVYATNSVIGYNTLDDGSETASDCYTADPGTLTLVAYNVISDITSCTYSEETANNFVGADPKLGELQTSYYPLLAGSPALNFIPAADCASAPTVDQLGHARPNGTPGLLPNVKCDAGAVEMSYATAVTPMMNANGASRGTTVKVTASSPLSAASANKSTFSVSGSQSGTVQTGYSGLNGSIALAPIANFFAGDVVQATATTALKASNGQQGLDAPVVWSFRTATKPGPGLNFHSAYGGGSTTDLALGDLTGDGYLDGVTAQPTTISIKHSNFYGDFTWADTLTIASGDLAAVNLADFNGDGKLDILGTAKSQVYLYLNNGDIRFAGVTPIIFNSGASNLKDAGIADVDADGDLDVVLVSTSTASKVFVNDGAGNFTLLGTSFGAGTSTAIAMDDMDRDGDMDAVIASTAGSNANTVWLNNGKGTFTVGATFGVAGNYVTTGDLNNDRYPDVVTTGNGSTHAGVWLNDGTGHFLSESPLSSGTEATGAALGDLDGDGDLDLVISNTYKAGGASNLETVWYNNGSGSLAAPAVNPTIDAYMETTAVAMGDVNNDGRIDAVFANTKTTAGGTASNNAETTFLNDTRPVSAPASKNGVEEADMSFIWSDFAAGYTDADQDPMLKVRIDSLPPATAGVLYQGGQIVTAGKDFTAAQVATLVFDALPNWSGTTTFTFSGSDGGFFSQPAIFTINYAGQDDAPIWASTIPDATVDEMVPMSIDLPSFVADIDTLPENLVFTFTSSPAITGTVNAATRKFEWTPTEAEGAGTYVITFKVTDGTTTVASNPVTITVKEVNLPPVFDAVLDKTVDEMSLLSFTVKATDPDNTNQTVTYELIGTPPTGAAFNPATRTFTWTPTEDQGPMVVTVTFRASDATDTSTLPVKITVKEVNALPVFEPVTAKTVKEGQTLTITVKATDTDTPTQPLTYSMPNKPAGSTFDATTKTFTWTPAEDQGPAQVTVTFRVDDTYGYTDLPVAVTVEEVNETPAFKPIADQVIDEGTALNFTVEALDPDLPKQTLTFAEVSLPQGATFDAATQKFAWTPSEAQGPNDYTATFSVTDKVIAQPVEMTVNIKVNEVNLDPVIKNGNVTAAAGRPMTFQVEVTDADIPVQVVTFGIDPTTLPQGATYTGTTFSWTPALTQVGDFVVKVWADDGVVAQPVTKNITITVRENHAPVITTGDQTVDENVELPLKIEATDADSDVVTITTDAAKLPEGATFANGTLTWTPSEAQGGASYDITFTADDGVEKTDKVIKITVAKTNSVPYFTAKSYDTTAYAKLKTVITVEAKDIDLPADTVTVALKAGTELPTFVTWDAAKGTFTIQPARTDAGVYTVTVTVTDGVIAQPVEKTITITVGFNGVFLPTVSR